jgi:hypothetical protein
MNNDEIKINGMWSTTFWLTALITLTVWGFKLSFTTSMWLLIPTALVLFMTIGHVFWTGLKFVELIGIVMSNVADTKLSAYSESKDNKKRK